MDVAISNQINQPTKKILLIINESIKQINLSLINECMNESNSVDTKRRVIETENINNNKK